MINPCLYIYLCVCLEIMLNLDHCFFSLELEHKADLVWPQSKDIICSVISPCSALLAIATTDNNIVIWDRYIGKTILLPHT